MSQYDDRIEAARAWSSDAAKNQHRLGVTPSAPTAGKSAKELRRVSFIILHGGKDFTLSLPELATEVFAHRAIQKREARKRRGELLTSNASLDGVPADPTDAEIDDALRFLRQAGSIQ
jgi:hypothetical protein